LLFETKPRVINVTVTAAIFEAVFGLSVDAELAILDVVSAAIFGAVFKTYGDCLA
jgi:hypothetical protein